MNLIFLLAVSIFCIAHIYFSLWKIQKTMLRFETSRLPELRFLYTNFKLTIVQLVLIVLAGASVCFSSFKLPFPFEAMQAGIFKYIGLFLVKFSCLWLLIASIEITRVLSGKTLISFRQCRKTDAATGIGTAILSLGVFFYIPGILTLLLVPVALYIPLINFIRANR